MGKWQLEVFKMALYVTFPVAAFHYFNQPENFEEWVVKTSRQMYRNEDKTLGDEVKRIAREQREEAENKILQALAEKEKTT